MILKNLFQELNLQIHLLKLKVKIDEDELIEGQRNKTLFKYAMKYAKGKTTLTKDDILNFLININNSKSVGLGNTELISNFKLCF